jgi:hypothetical protein
MLELGAEGTATGDKKVEQSPLNIYPLLATYSGTTQEQ